MYCSESNIVVFGYSEFAKELLENVCAKSLLVCDTDKDKLISAKEANHDTAWIDVHNDYRLQEVLKDKDLLFVLSSDEALNAYMVITARMLSKDIIIITLGAEIDKHKLILAGANKIIDPYFITANKIFDMLQKPLIVNLLDEVIFANQDLNVAEIRIPKGSTLDGKYIDECDFRQYNLILTGIIDKALCNTFSFVTGHHRHMLNDDDMIVVIGKENDIIRLKIDIGIEE